MLFRSVPHGSVEDLACQMKKLVEEPERRERLGRRAVQWAGNFSWETTAEKMLKEMEDAADAI